MFLGIVLIQCIGKELITEILYEQIILYGHLFVFSLNEFQSLLPMFGSYLYMHIR